MPMPEHVILLHGFFHDGQDMQTMATALQQFGYTTSTPNLPLTTGSISTAKPLLRQHVEACAQQHNSLHCIAHSQGGLVLRHMLADYAPSELKSCCFLGTPHHGSRLATLAMHQPGYTKRYPAILDLSPRCRHPRLPQSTTYRTAAIAGTSAGGNLLSHLLLRSPHDARVEQRSALPDDIEAQAVVPLAHRQLQTDAATLNLLRYFLRHGRLPARRYVLRTGQPYASA